MFGTKLIGLVKTAVFFVSAVAAMLAIVFIFPAQRSSASVRRAIRTGSHDDGLTNYDVRLDKAAAGQIKSIESRLAFPGPDRIEAQDLRSRGEAALRASVPSLEVTYNPELGNAEVIGPDVKKGPMLLTSAQEGKRSEILRSFVAKNSDLFGVSSQQAEQLVVDADYTDPNGRMSFAQLHQEINGVPVFRGLVKAGFTSNGALVRVINDLAPDVSTFAVSQDFGDPAAALRAALPFAGGTAAAAPLLDRSRSTSDKAFFGTGDSASVAEKMYFPLRPGEVVPSWRVLIWNPVNAYYVIVDAATGSLLWRKNISEDQSQPATYSVYTNANRYLNIEHSPFPLSPATASPLSTQGAGILRTPVTRVGNEPPYDFNDLGWIKDGDTKTDGNAVQAGLDRDDDDGIDTGSEAVNATRNFTFDYSPYDPNTGVGDAPVPAVQTYPGTAFQQGAVTQLFYICNWYHDETYRLGFTEAAGNFQDSNFGRQGDGGDRVRAEAQDSSGTNNANFATPADGNRPRMQMYLFTGPNPNIDGSLDADVVVHEHTHGLSNRLHGDSMGLFNDMSRGMGEGWSDFFGMSMLSQPSDPTDGLYTTGEYVSYRVSSNFVSNGYYGIRRFPTARLSSVGPNGKPHDPLTFRDIDATQMDLSRGAFAPRFTGTSDEVHNTGEIWCSMLWEIRARFIDRLGWDVGNRKVMQIAIDGMKLAPLSPTFVTERDAMVAAAVAEGTPYDVADIWAGFASRGLGVSASIQDVGGTSIGGAGKTRVTEAFDLPNLSQSAASFTVSDRFGDGDGYPEAGEMVMLTVPITNNTGKTATGVTVRVPDGGSANYGTIDGTSTASRDIAYQLPASAQCGGIVSVTLNVSSGLGNVSFTRQIFVGKPGTTTDSENFDGVVAPGFPSGWTAESVSGGTNFVTVDGGADSPPNAAFALDPSSVGGGTDLTSPPISVTTAGATVAFRNRVDTEAGWDGGVLEISVAGGPWTDIITAGGTFVQNGYNDILGAGTNNPVGSRAGWTGDSHGYMTTVVQLPDNAAGKIIQLKWRFGADNNTAATGWTIDSVQLQGAGFVTSFECSVPSNAAFAVSGRVQDERGRGVANASVVLAGAIGGPFRVNTSSLGFYSFDAVPAGHNYSVAVTSKRFRFATKAGLDVTSDLQGLNFVGLE